MLQKLWKEKISGNPGFDFHTETPTEFIAFGEAKYRAASNAYNLALKQIKDFIQEKKDLKELSDLKNFVGAKAISNISNLNLKAFIAAVFGGIGSIPGAMIGGLFIGIAETMVTAYGSSLYKDAIVYIILILILILKPAGLLGKNVREKV